MNLCFGIKRTIDVYTGTAFCRLWLTEADLSIDFYQEDNFFLNPAKYSQYKCPCMPGLSLFNKMSRGTLSTFYEVLNELYVWEIILKAVFILEK